jgi:putative transposase
MCRRAIALAWSGLVSKTTACSGSSQESGPRALRAFGGLDQSALLEVLDALKTAEVDDRIRQAAQTIYQALIEAELTSLIGAAPHQRTPDRSAQRNGHRPRLLATTAGGLELRIPKLRAGSFFPSLLERRRRVDQALFAVVMEAYLHGVSTHKVDDLVRALGADSGISNVR